MKLKISSLLVVLLITLPCYAQKGKEQLKKASKAHLMFSADNSLNIGKLEEATNAIDLAIKDPEIIKEAKVWLMRGTIYNDIATQRTNYRQLGFGDISKLPDVKYPALEAVEAFNKARKLAQKRYESKEAIKGLMTAQSNLANEGVYAYELRDYKGAYTQLAAVIEVHKTIKDAGENSSLDGEGTYENQQYIAGLAALNAQMYTEAKAQFEDLYRKKHNEPVIYEALYNIITQDENNDINDAYKYLKQGRERFPDDAGLLFAEINHLLRTSQLDEVISKLKAAIEKEPGNVSLYNTLGNVYDNLHQRESQGGDPDLVNQYYQNAMDYYTQGLAKDPNNMESNYNIGALYFNVAALETKVLMELSEDFSAEGVKKFEKKKVRVMELFSQALPYFQKAESLNPNDINTLIALKEIYARQDDIERSNIFKDRLENVQSGRKNKTSYFSN